MPNSIQKSNTMRKFNDLKLAKPDYNEIGKETKTRIANKNDGFDKNAFFKILAAELSNQDPMNAKDSTAYISQLAQFSSLEQMANLNSTMTFSSAAQLVGKNVNLNIPSLDGTMLSGVILNVERSGDKVELNVETSEGEKKVEFKNVHSINDKTGMSISSAASVIGKRIKIVANDGSDNVYEGVAKSVFQLSDGTYFKADVNKVALNRDMTVVSGRSTVSPAVKGFYTGKDGEQLSVRYNSKFKHYEYKIGKDGKWDLLNGVTNVDGIEIRKPLVNPSENVEWALNLRSSAMKEPKIIAFPTRNLVEVLGEDSPIEKI